LWFFLFSLRCFFLSSPVFYLVRPLLPNRAILYLSNWRCEPPTGARSRHLSLFFSSNPAYVMPFMIPLTQPLAVAGLIFPCRSRFPLLRPVLASSWCDSLPMLDFFSFFFDKSPTFFKYKRLPLSRQPSCFNRPPGI